MAERLPAPRHERFPDLEGDDVRILPAGSDIGRIYSARGAHGTSWNTFRAFGPTKCRFDHQTTPVRAHLSRRVMYGAPAVATAAGTVYPVLKTCLAECFRDAGVVHASRNAPYFAVFATTRDLRLLDMGDSDWVTRAGGNAAISSGSRAMAREWARVIYRRYVLEAGAGPADRIDGLIYPSSNIPVARSLVLWDPAESALPATPDLNLPLNLAALRASVETYAGELGLGLVF